MDGKAQELMVILPLLGKFKSPYLTFTGVPFDDLCSEDEDLDFSYKHKYEGALQMVT